MNHHHRMIKALQEEAEKFPEHSRTVSGADRDKLLGAADVLARIPCEHLPAPAGLSPAVRAKCQYCDAPMVRRWVAETPEDAEAYETGTAEPGHERATTGNPWPSEFPVVGV